MPTPAIPPAMTTRRATSRAASPWPRAQRGFDQRLGRDGDRVEGQRAEEPQLQGDLMRADRRHAEPGGDRGRGQEAGLDAAPRIGRSRPSRSCRRDDRRAGAQRSRLPDRARSGTAAGHGLSGHVGDGRAGQAPARREDEPRAEDRGEDVGPEHEEQWPAGVLHAAHPAVAGRGEQQAGAPSAAIRNQPAAASAVVGSPARAVRAVRRRLREQASEYAGGQRQPGGLHALATAAGRSPAPKRRAARPVVP